MGDYTKLNLQNIREIISLYKDDKVNDFKPLSLGISNSNYMVIVDGEKYLLKVSNDKNADQVLEEMRILQILKDQGYEYSLTPIQTKGNELIYQTHDFYGVLFPFIEGIPPGPNDATCFEIGRALAKLHTIKCDFTKIRNSEELSYPEKVIKDYLLEDECPKEFKEAYIKLFEGNDNTYFSQNFEQGIIHGDLYYDNTLFYNNHLKAVLDFEQSGIGNLIFDLGISISGCCLEKERISLPLIDSYLKGYESIRKLPENEKQFLNEAIIFGLLSISLWRIKRFTVGDLNPLMADSYQELLYRAKIFKQTIKTVKND